MKKIFLFSVCIAVISASKAQFNTWVIRPNAGAGVHFTEINSAVNSSVVNNGDTLDIMGNFITSTIILNKELFIRGNGVNNTVISPSGNNSIFVSATKKISINSLVLNGVLQSSVQDAACHIEQVPECTINNVNFENFNTNTNGGALYVAATSRLSVSNCEFINNKAGAVGGAIYITALKGKGIIENCTFEKNGAVNNGWGNAIMLDNGTGSPDSLIVKNCTFYNNGRNNTGLGGTIGINYKHLFLEIINNTFASNRGNNNAGDLYLIPNNGYPANLRYIGNLFYDTRGIVIPNGYPNTGFIRYNLSTSTLTIPPGLPNLNYIIGKNRGNCSKDTMLKLDLAGGIPKLTANGGSVRTIKLTEAGNLAVEYIVEAIGALVDARNEHRKTTFQDCGAYEINSLSPIDTALFPQTPSLSDTVYTYNFQTAPQDIRLATVSLQGLVNRTKARIFLKEVNSQWLLDLYIQKGYVHKEIPYTNIYNLLSDFKTYFSGVVVYDPAKPFTINLATNIAGVQNRVVISPEMLPGIINALGAGVNVLDLRALNFPDMLTAHLWYENNVLPFQNKKILSVSGYHYMHDVYRDYLVQHKIPVFWLPAPADPDYNSAYESRILNLFAATSPNIPILGFWPGLDQNNQQNGYSEYAGVKLAGKYGKYTVVNTWVGNYSYHTAVNNQPVNYYQAQVRNKVYKPFDPSKKYVALVMTESGDSPAYMQYAFNQRQWSDNLRGQVPINYGITPAMQYLLPAYTKYLYNSASQNDFFFCAISGNGYCYPFEDYGDSTANPEKCKADYFKSTAVNMQKMDLDMLGIYTHPGSVWTTADLQTATKYIAPMPGLKSIISGMHRVPGYTGANSFLNIGNVTVNHTLTIWPSQWFAHDNTTLDQAAVDYLKTEIQTYGANGNFIQAMFYSFNYGPRRLKMLKEQMEPLGYEFVTLPEFDHYNRVNKFNLPDKAGPILGSTDFCDNTTETYSILPVFNATSYVWTLPAGATGNSSSNSITITFGSGQSSGTISVKAVNSNGESNVSVLNLFRSNNCISPSLKLVEFSASSNDCKTFLKWTTENEVNVKDFEVEISTDGTFFVHATTLLAGQNPFGKSEYSCILFTDPAIAFFRIKISDWNGKYIYGPVKKCQLNCYYNNTVVLVSPNHVANGISSIAVKIKTSYSGNCNLMLMNSLQQLVVSRLFRLQSGVNTTNLPLGDLSSGVYFFVITNDEGKLIAPAYKVLKE